MAVQLAKTRGARVIGTASTVRHEQLRTLGVEPINYAPGLVDRVREPFVYRPAHRAHLPRARIAQRGARPAQSPSSTSPP